MEKGEPVMCHCRGGVGRAGTLAACLILLLKLKKTKKGVIKMVRHLRDKRAVESRKQEDYIKNFINYLK